jgi:hypothetical protein
MTKFKWLPGLLMISFTIFLFSSCLSIITGEGEVSLATRNIGKFTKIELNLDASVILTDSLEQSCMISAQENLMAVIETKVKGEKLIISSEKIIRTDKPIIIYLSVNRISDIELNGSGKITATNDLKSGNIDMDLSGSGRIDVRVIADKIKGEISGSGTIMLKGSSNESDYDISGSGVIDAFQLSTGNCKIEISGSGEAHVFPSGNLKASISGSGKVLYKGVPAKIDHSISGSGSIEKSE